MEAPSFFSQFFMWMGPYKWPMIIVSSLVVVLILKKAIELLIPTLSNERKASGVNAILFWGALSMAFGIYVQTVSLWMALKEIMVAADISPQIVLIGFYGSFCPTIFGTLTLIVAALAWWFFRYRINIIDVTS
jgi:hypothetical protein